MDNYFFDSEHSSTIPILLLNDFMDELIVYYSTSGSRNIYGWKLSTMFESLPLHIYFFLTSLNLLPSAVHFGSASEAQKKITEYENQVIDQYV